MASRLKQLRLTQTGGETVGLEHSHRQAQAQGKAQTGNKKSDTELAAYLNGIVMDKGLIYVRSQQALNDIHQTYDASLLLTSIQSWQETFNSTCEDLLFIDTETNGLSGGVGTLAFLLGVAEVKGNTIINHQLFLNGMSGEKAMLNWFNKILDKKTTLVSYNGKSFDIPLLANRFRLQRMSSPLLTLAHVDLLHWVRRMYQKYWPDCRLPSAEQHCLNFSRNNDISGAEAPLIWSRLVRQGEVGQLKPLLQHHYWDVLSLVGILDYVIRGFSTNGSSKMNYFAIANYLQKQGRSRQAQTLLESNQNVLCGQGLMLLSKFYKQQKHYQKALVIWKSLTEKNDTLAIEFLAKHYEHIQKDYSEALMYAHRLVSLSAEPLHEKRKVRLIRKLECSLS